MVFSTVREGADGERVNDRGRGSVRVLRTRRLPVRSKCEQPIQNRRTGHYHGGHFEDDLVVTSIVHAVRSRVPQVEIVGISMVPDNALQRHRNPPVPDQCCPTAAGTHSVSRGRGCRFAFAATPNRRSCTPRRTPSPRRRGMSFASSGAFFVVSWYRVLAWSSVGWLSSASSPSRARPASSASQFGDLSPPR